MSRDDVKGLVPVLRFPEFLDHPDWSSKELKELGDVMSGLTYKPEDVRDEGLLVLRSSNVQNGRISLEDCVYVRPDIRGANISRPKDILICVRNGSKPLIGKNALLPERLPASTHGAFMSVFRAANPEFVFQLFQTSAYEKHVSADLGATINSINSNQLKKYRFLVPVDDKEQQKIADCLSSIDKLITAQAEKIEALKAHKKGLMQKLFPAEGKTTPELRFPEFRESARWKESTIGNISDISSGGTPSRSNSEFWGGNIPWVSTTLIDFNEITQAQEFITQAGIDNSSAKVYPPSTILMAMYGQGKTRGKVAQLRIEASINQACAAISVRGAVTSDFVYLNLSARYSEIREFSNQGGQENLSATLIKKIPFSFPDIKTGEQHKIADCLSSINRLLEAHKEKHESLKKHKQGLMQQLFPNIDEAN